MATNTQQTNTNTAMATPATITTAAVATAAGAGATAVPRQTSGLFSGRCRCGLSADFPIVIEDTAQDLAPKTPTKPAKSAMERLREHEQERAKSRKQQHPTMLIDSDPIEEFPPSPPTPMRKRVLQQLVREPTSSRYFPVRTSTFTSSSSSTTVTTTANGVHDEDVEKDEEAAVVEFKRPKQVQRETAAAAVVDRLAALEQAVLGSGHIMEKFTPDEVDAVFCRFVGRGNTAAAARLWVECRMFSHGPVRSADAKRLAVAGSEGRWRKCIAPMDLDVFRWTLRNIGITRADVASDNYAFVADIADSRPTDAQDALAFVWDLYNLDVDAVRGADFGWFARACLAGRLDLVHWASSKIKVSQIARVDRSDFSALRFIHSEAVKAKQQGVADFIQTWFRIVALITNAST